MRITMSFALLMILVAASEGFNYEMKKAGNYLQDKIQLINICELQKYKELNLYCVCDDEDVEKARNVNCAIFNDSEKEDSPIWDEFQSQPNIETLQFTVRSLSNFSFVPPRALKYLSELQKLKVSHGTVERLKPFAFANLTRLQEIELTENRIRVLDKYSISNLISLTELSLGENYIEEIEREVFVNLPSLTKLFLENNRINLIHDGAFSQLYHLEELELHKNQLNVITRETFMGLRSLKRLDLHDNRLSIIGDYTFSDLMNLEELFLEQNSIEKIGARAFYGNPNIYRLILAENKLQVIPEDAFAEMRKLRVLDLRDNFIQTLTYNTISPSYINFKNETSYLFLQGNRLECDCRLSWLHELINETSSEQITSMLKPLSCYMKFEYFNNDLVDMSGLILDHKLSSSSQNGLININDDEFPTRENGTENMDRMMKLFSIPINLLPCPEKKETAKEVLMEQTAQHDQSDINNSYRILPYSFFALLMPFFLLYIHL